MKAFAAKRAAFLKKQQEIKDVQSTLPNWQDRV